MTPQGLLAEAAQRGIELYPDGHTIHYRGPKGALADLKPNLAARKGELLTLLRAEQEQAETDRLARAVTPDSRAPLIPPEVRAKIEAIEAAARAKGWPAELLWNAGFWDNPRGLAAVLNPEDEIAEVTADFITILKTRRDLLRFQRRTA